MTLYLRHFGLREAPFKITPTTEFFYAGGRRGEILHALQYAISSGEGIMMVSGEVGSGKTMLLRTLLEKLPEETDIVYIPNPSLSGREILYHICEELELQIDQNRPDTVRMLQNYLIERSAQGRRVVAFIDEAQAMPDESLEEIRLLSNLETSRNKLLQIVMFGQPELDDKLRRQNMRQLRERITVSLTLEPFSHRDIREYISTRLRAAGYNGGQLFADDALKLIAAISQGLSRRINVLADKSMLSAFTRRSFSVDYGDAKRAAQDVRFGKLRYRSEQSKRFSRQLTVALSTASAALILLAAFAHWGGENSPAATTVANAPQAESEIQTQTQPESQTEIQQAEEGAVADSAVAELEKPREENAGGLSSPELPSPSSLAENSFAQFAEAEEIVAPVVAVATLTVAATVTAASPVVDVDVNSGEKMRAAILAMQTESDSVSGESLAEEIAAAAEEHSVPQKSGGNAAVSSEDWGIAAAPPPDLADNPDWQWMPAESYLRGRLNATQTWLSREEGRRGFTARIITVSQERGVFLEKFLRRFADFYPIRNVMAYPARIGERDRFVVTFGVYATREESDVFIANIPRYFTGGRPFTQQLVFSAEESVVVN